MATTYLPTNLTPAQEAAIRGAYEAAGRAEKASPTQANRAWFEATAANAECLRLAEKTSRPEVVAALREAADQAHESAQEAWTRRAA